MAEFQSKAIKYTCGEVQQASCITLPISKVTDPLERSHVPLEQRNNNFTFAPRSRAGSAPQHVLCIISIFCTVTFWSQKQTYKALLAGNERTVGGENKSESRFDRNHQPSKSQTYELGPPKVHEKFEEISKENHCCAQISIGSIRSLKQCKWKISRIV